MPWYDSFKVFTYAFEEDPQTKRRKAREITGQGYSDASYIPNIRGNGGDGMFSGARSSLRIGNDFIDLSSVGSRGNRLKEYERLRSIPEIEQVMTVIADETCLAGSTEIQTLYHGLKTIKWLAENMKEEFFVYSWDFDKEDYTIGLAYDARLVKKAPTVKVLLDDGTHFIATKDHRVLLRNGAWAFAGDLKFGDLLMPFYRMNPNHDLTENKKNQFPRIWTHSKGWVHERQFIDEWKSGKDIEKYNKINQAGRMFASGLNTKQTCDLMKHQWPTIDGWIRSEGFSSREFKWLGRKKDQRRVLGVIEHEEIDVYDLSVKDHQNFCGKSVVFHNCQKDNKGNVIDITVKNDAVKQELDFLFLHRGMLNLNRRIWGITKKLCINGDWFGELVLNPENPKDGILKMVDLPAESVYRIETTKGKLMEFQQGGEGPDYEAVAKTPVTDATEAELDQGKVIRFTPQQIIHLRLGEDRKTFAPYGQSLIEPARGPAHQLRLMEDAMVVYRLTRAPERRVFYIDVGNMPSYRAETFMQRMQDLLRKKKVVRPGEGASAIDEKWDSPSAIDDFWIPVRQNSSTRIESLPGATNLGEIDDTVYFRNKLYVALNFPANYFASEDVGATRITVSSQVAKFARMLERIQENIQDGLWEIADRHLQLLGYPPELYEDLKINMTPPSEWRDLSRAEVENNRINNANALKGSMLYSDLDILIKILKIPEKEAQDMVSRTKIQKLEEARLQIFVQNPQLAGVGAPGAGEDQMGAESGGPSPMLGPDGAPPPPEGSPPPPDAGGGPAPGEPQGPAPKNVAALPEPEEDEIKRFDLEIQNYDKEQDHEEVDFSEI